MKCFAVLMNDWLESSCYDLNGGHFVADEEAIENVGDSRETEIYFSVSRMEKVSVDGDRVKAIGSMMRILSVGVGRDSSFFCRSELHLQAFCFFGRICPPRPRISVWGDVGLLDCRDGGYGDGVCAFVGLCLWA